MSQDREESTADSSLPDESEAPASAEVDGSERHLKVLRGLTNPRRLQAPRWTGPSGTSRCCEA